MRHCLCIKMIVGIWALVTAADVWAQQPQALPPASATAVPVRSPWNDADRLASRAMDESQSTPTQVARDLVWAVQTNQWDEAALCVSGVDVSGTSDGARAVELLKKFSPLAKEEGLQRAIEEGLWEVDDKNDPHEKDRHRPVRTGKEIKVPITIVASDALQVELRATEMVKFRREVVSWPKGNRHEAGSAGVWRIIPPAKAGKPTTKFGVVETYARMLSDANTAMNDVIIGRTKRQAAEIGLAFMLSLQDTDEKFDMTEANWTEKLMRYVKSPDIFKAPGDTGLTGYSFNRRLSGKSAGDIPMSSLTVLMYLGKDEKLEGRYNGLATVCFADGHVKMVPPGKTLQWEP